MAEEKYFPFRSVSGDRKYSAEDWAEYFAQFLSNGVYYSDADKLKVVEYEGMKVKVQKGSGLISGRMYALKTDKILTLDTADGVLNRIDRIVLRCDYAKRLMSAEVLKGSYSEAPTAPELTRDADVYELALADVYIAAGAIAITTVNITDQRLNVSLCGFVTSPADERVLEEIVELDERLTGEIENLDEGLTKEKAERKAEIATERKRIDNISTLKEGSTTGDAELTDIRIGADGTVYNNAGEAVRAVEKKANVAFVFTNTAPIVEYVNKERVTLTFKSTTHIFYGDNGRYDLAETTVSCDLGGNTWNIFKIIFDTVGKSISLILSTQTIPNGYVLIGFVYKDTIKLNTWVQSETGVQYPDTTLYPITWTDESPIFEITGSTCTITFPATVHLYYNRVKLSINSSSFTFTVSANNFLHYLLVDPVSKKLSALPHGSIIPGGHVAFGFFHTRRGVYLFGQGSKHIEAKKPATLILGRNNKYVEFDSVNKTITFPDDTVIVMNNDMTGTYCALKDSNGNTTADWSAHATSAICVYYNRFTKLLECLRYDDVVDDRYILLCSFRTHTGTVSITVPYRWDGKLFNIISANDTGQSVARNYNVKAVNHRGYSAEAPENTLSAYRLSKLKGFDYVECDVSFTSDNVAVLLHDGTVDRTSNGTGDINSLTFEEVRALDFGSWFSSAYAGEQIPSFEEFMVLCRNIGLHPYIEIKSSATYTQTQIESLVDIVKRVGMTSKVTWISFNNNYLSYVKNYDDKARLGYLIGDVAESNIAIATGLKTASNEVFIDSSYELLTDEKIALCVNADLPLEVWTINDSSIIASLDPYVSGVTSDNLIAGEVLYNTNIG